EKRIYEYENIKGEPHEVKAKNINPYLIDAKDILIEKRTKPLCNVPTMQKGNQPTDEGNFLFTTEEKNEFLKQEPNAKKFFRKFIGSEEFINKKERWCLWLKDISPSELKQLPKVLERVENIRNFRLKSAKAATRKKADTPALFDEIR